MTSAVIDAERLQQVMEATWRTAAASTVGPWTIREGKGGGKRVSAATADGDWQDTDIPVAETAMAALGQSALFVIRAGDDRLDQALMARGYRIVDPVVAYAAPIATLALPPEPMTTFPHWPPMAIAADLWAEGGVGAARLAIMDRVVGPKTAILSRAQDRAAGIAFVAVHENIAMLHALEVTTLQRRQGSAHNILRAAAIWAQANGADTLLVVVTVANDAARRLYASLAMKVVGQYHYRQK
ncbi:MAG: family N-acetyltransferase [Cypionkella sp.]|nr:family N-acetyltransferase [Cypionkella sp.]